MAPMCMADWLNRLYWPPIHCPTHCLMLSRRTCVSPRRGVWPCVWVIHFLQSQPTTPPPPSLPKPYSWRASSPLVLLPSLMPNRKYILQLSISIYWPPMLVCACVVLVCAGHYGHEIFNWKFPWKAPPPIIDIDSEVLDALSWTSHRIRGDRVGSNIASWYRFAVAHQTPEPSQTKCWVRPINSI